MSTVVNRLFITAAVTRLVSMASTEAEACGTWTLRDLERRSPVIFLCHNVWHQKRMIFTIWGSRSRLRAVDTKGKQINSPRGHETILAFKSGGRLFLGQQQVGQMRGGALTLGKRRYRILTELPGAPRAVRVLSRGRVVARTKYSMSFAAGRWDVARRVALYLAWRDLIAPRVPDRQP